MCAAAAEACHAALLRVVLLLALAAGASSTPCAPGRENSVDGATVATDTVSNVNGVTLAGCNNTITRVTAGAPVTITGSDDLVLQNLAGTVTVTGNFDAVVGNDVQATGEVTVTGDFNALVANNVTHMNSPTRSAGYIRISGDRNVVESNSAMDYVYVSDASDNLVARNTVTHERITVGGIAHAAGNTIVNNTASTDFLFDYGFEVRWTAQRRTATSVLALPN